MMNKEEKNILSAFLKMKVPVEFLNTVDKMLYNEMLKGTLYGFLENNTIEINNVEELFSLKNQLFNNIDFKNSDNIVYFDCCRASLSILYKYSKK